MTDRLHEIARACLEAGIDAAHPERVVGDAVTHEQGTLAVGGRPPDGGPSADRVRYRLADYDRLLVVGGGNAAGTAAAALETVLGDAIDDGLVVSDVPVPTERIDVCEGTHPVPGESAAAATSRLTDLLADAGEDTLVVAVVTGGASALLPAPAEGLTLADLRATTEALLASGADIHEVNAVRKHCSASKGGGLAARAAPATVVALLFSDVVGDDPAVIGSGPFAPDTSTLADARAVLDRYDVDVPTAVRDHLETAAETPGPDDSTFASVTPRLLADGDTAAAAAAEAAGDHGFDPLVLSTRVRGEAREAATTHVAVAEQMRATGDPIAPPAVVVSGGETTVRREGAMAGTGGPNAEFALAAALELDVSEAVVAAVDTDGIDGNAETAGASIDADTVTDETAARAALETHDAAGYLEDVGATVHTGPTGTNVNDLRVVVLA
ncbi:glycerate kinase [Halosegnis sp.]|uniref:glycerate kinase type-2 family protein n=1 Tax=Halosegnis sp. TaxID=2864959 RepID=UPI0035D44FD9